MCVHPHPYPHPTLQAKRLLKPGGYFAISDFTITPELSLFTRTVWPAIFAHDGVHLNMDHLITLREMFTEVHCTVDRGGFPWIPVLKAPYYFAVFQKK